MQYNIFYIRPGRPLA